MSVGNLQSEASKRTQVLLGPITCRVCGKQLHLTARCCEDCGTPVPGRVFPVLWAIRMLLMMIGAALLVLAYDAPTWGTTGWALRVLAGVLLLVLSGLSFLLTVP